MMLFLVFVAALASMASATTYSLSVYAPGNAIHGAILNAAGQAFYTGIDKPATYCPVDSAQCPEVAGTLVTANMSAMAVEVPGGQQIYVHPSGQVKYTQAHSAYTPLGSIVGGWYNKTVVSDCAPPAQVLDFYAPNASGVTGLLLCPDIDDFMEGTGASYQLYAHTASFNETDCENVLGINMQGNVASVGTWQYM